MISSLRAHSFVPTTLARKTTRPLNRARIDALVDFLDDARRRPDIPVAALGIVQIGEVMYAGGLGMRELGKAELVDASTLFLNATTPSSPAPSNDDVLDQLASPSGSTWVKCDPRRAPDRRGQSNAQRKTLTRCQRFHVLT